MSRTRCSSTRRRAPGSIPATRLRRTPARARARSCRRRAGEAPSRAAQPRGPERLHERAGAAALGAELPHHHLAEPLERRRPDAAEELGEPAVVPEAGDERERIVAVPE